MTSSIFKMIFTEELKEDLNLEWVQSFNVSWVFPHLHCGTWGASTWGRNLLGIQDDVQQDLGWGWTGWTLRGADEGLRGGGGLPPSILGSSTMRGPDVRFSKLEWPESGGAGN